MTSRPIPRPSILLISALIAGTFALANCEVETTSLSPIPLATSAETNAAPNGGQVLGNWPISPEVRGLYTSGSLIWHNQNGSPKRRTGQLFEILQATSAHGLREEYYLPTSLLATDRLGVQSPENALAVDMILTQALYDFAGDFRYGRFNPKRPNTLNTS